MDGSVKSVKWMTVLTLNDSIKSSRHATFLFKQRHPRPVQHTCWQIMHDKIESVAPPVVQQRPFGGGHSVSLAPSVGQQRPSGGLPMCFNTNQWCDSVHTWWRLPAPPPPPPSHPLAGRGLAPPASATHPGCSPESSPPESDSIAEPVLLLRLEFSKPLGNVRPTPCNVASPYNCMGVIKGLVVVAPLIHTSR
jgi:hypothetical protein